MQLENSRVVIDTRDEETRVNVGPGRKHDATIFFSIWMSGWAFFEVFCLYQVAFGDITGIACGFVCVWLTAWTFGGVLAGFALAFLIFGREHITLTATSLRIDVSIARWTRSQTYPLEKIARVRRNPAAFELVGAADSTDNEMMLFDHDEAPVRFGRFLEEADVRVILDAIAERAPGLVAA